VLWGAVITICTLLGGFAALVAFLPRISVAVQSPTNPDDPFSSPFTLRNDGFLPLYDIESACAIRSAVATPISHPNAIQQIQGDSNYGTLFQDPHFATSTLEPDQTIDVPCAYTWFAGQKVKSADMAIVVFFKPSRLPWPRRKKIFPFLLATDPETNQLRWLSTGSGRAKPNPN